ncbi:MAG: response regulator [Alistipes sp.]|nr:response regulator [Alistipes senegalensis]MCM1250538.1 response regulator [Alistipes sp.]
MLPRLLFFLAVLLPFGGSAKERQYAFRPLNVDDGLAHNTVLAIMQDRTGFMWFGTKDGLNRYDGQEIRTVAAVDAIPGNNYITALCEDAEGKIWIGTDAGVCIYDPETERAERFLQPADDGCVIKGNIPQIVMAPDSTVWIPAGSRGFFRYDSRSRALTHIRGERSGTRLYTTRNLCFTAQNTACLVLDDGNIYLSDDGLGSIVPLFADGGTEAFCDRFVKKIVPGTRNRIYVCSSRGLFEVNLATRRFRKIVLPHSNDYVRDLLAVRSDEIWVATESCLEILDGHLQETAFFYADNKSPYALRDNSIYCLCKDRQGGMWAGTYFAGVAYSRAGASAPVRRYYSNPLGRNLGWHVREIVADEDGDLWIGTESKSLFRYRAVSDEIEPVWDDELLSSNIHGLCCDGDYVWVGTYEQSRTLIRIHRRTLAEKSYPSAGKEIYTICKTAAGDLWIGTTSGLKRYDRTGDRFVVDTAVRSHIHHLREDSAGNLWAATYSDGLYRYDALNATWQHFVYDEQNPASLAADKVLSVFEDSRSQLWFTTEGGGLCRYLPERGDFVRYKSDLPFDTLYRIEEDDAGLFWITSNKGLVRFDPESRNYFVFTTDDGLLSNQFNYSSSCKTRDGRIYAGCSIGFISFDPREMKPDDAMFPIVPTDFMLYNRSIGVGEGDSPLTKSISLLDRLDLAPDENSFSLRVAAIDYQSPHEARMRYRLEGFDSHWHALRGHTISYSNLPYRSYRLVIEGLRSNGEPNGSLRTLDIRIRPPFYLSPVAQICYVLFAIAAVGLVYTIVVRRSTRKREERIEKIERRKERELYVAKFDFFTNIAHEIRTPLSLIRGPLENVARKERDTSDEELREDIRTMEQNTDRLMTLIDQLLDFRKAEKGGFKLRPVECDIRETVRAVYDRFGTMARQRKLELSASFPEEEVRASVDCEALTKIVSNLLSNALKYAESRIRLELTAESDPRRFRIVMTNDGQVVPQDQREAIFRPFVQYRDGRHVMTGTGIGLTLARSLAELHGGTLEMDRSTEINRFILTVPIVRRTEEFLAVSQTLPEPSSDGGRQPAGGNGGRAALLVVEDDPGMLGFVSRQLAGFYDVSTAEHGAAALAMLRNGSFDLIVSDVMMPEMDGLELCRRVKSDLRFSHIPVLLLTAKIDIVSKVEGLDTGADAYVEKPFSPEYLRASISALLSNRERVRRHFLESPFVRSETLAYSKADQEFMRKLDDFILRNMGHADLSVDGMADEMCMSNSNLFRKLKAIIGKNPNEYLRIRRLKRAAELLGEEKFSIADIALIVGFRSATYFSTCFKKQFGISPMEFVEKRGLRP